MTRCSLGGVTTIMPCEIEFFETGEMGSVSDCEREFKKQQHMRLGPSMPPPPSLK